MKVTITEEQEERFVERMTYIDKIIKNSMPESEWSHLLKGLGTNIKFENCLLWEILYEKY